MILTGKEISKRVANGEISISNFKKSQVNPNSYNLTLGKKLLYYKNTPKDTVLSRLFYDVYKLITGKYHKSQVIDMKKENEIVEIDIPEEGYVLHPGIVYLARVEEYTETYGLVPMLEGRSSIGRLGIEIHRSAGFGDTGFKGYWTLEISCVQPVRIYSGVEVCQMYYHEIVGEETTYEGKYQNQMDIKPSELFKDTRFSNQKCLL